MRRVEEARLPNAIRLAPECGTCYNGTFYSSKEVLECTYCRLTFDEDMHPSYANEEDRPCGKMCEVTHYPISGGRWECHPCALPEGHTERHWYGCHLEIIYETSQKATVGTDELTDLLDLLKTGDVVTAFYQDADHKWQYEGPVVVLRNTIDIYGYGISWLDKQGVRHVNRYLTQLIVRPT